MEYIITDAIKEIPNISLQEEKYTDLIVFKSLSAAATNLRASLSMPNLEKIEEIFSTPKKSVYSPQTLVGSSNEFPTNQSSIYPRRDPDIFRIKD